MRRFFLLVVLATLCTTVPAQGKALKSLWGPLTLPNGKSAGPTYRSLGVDVLQMGANWDGMAPTRPASPRNFADPAYRWSSEIDKAVALGRKYGFSVALLVRGTPNWANGGRGPHWAPSRSKDFADFLYAASKRYPSVKRWMIWGEPNRRDNFNPMPTNSPAGPRRYARLLDSAYGALKRANKRNIVIGGMTFTAGDVVPRDFVKWARLPNGKPPRVDRWGHNPFSTRIPNLKEKPFSDGNYDFSDLDTMYRQLHRAYKKAYPRFRRSGPSIWISEFTIQADHGSFDFNFYVSTKDQGRWIRAAFAQANKTRYINNVGWLGLLDEPVADYNRTTGLLKYDLSRKPSYWAFKSAP